MIIWLDAFYYLHSELDFFFPFQYRSTTLIYNWYKYMYKSLLYPLWIMPNPSCADQTFASSFRSVIVSSPNDVVDLSFVWTHSSWPKNNMFIQIFFFKTLGKYEHESGHKWGERLSMGFFCTDTLSDVSLPVYPPNQGAFCNSLRWLSASSQHERRKPPSAGSYWKDGQRRVPQKQQWPSLRRGIPWWLFQVRPGDSCENSLF